MTIVIDAFAIVSANDCIADAKGRFPPELMNDADWVYFQNELDHCDYVVVGRASHDATPNIKKRRRIVMSLSARELEQRDDALFWNPAHWIGCMCVKNCCRAVAASVCREGRRPSIFFSAPGCRRFTCHRRSR